MGRTGSLFAAEQEGITAGLITIAQGLGAGYQPIGATLLSGRIRDAIAQGSGYFQHGHTYIGHATACAAALAVQKAVEQRGLLKRVVQLGDSLQAQLVERLGQHPHVGDIRGRGLFRGIELVADRESKTPFAPELKLHARFKKTAMDQGLMCYPMGGTLDGQRGDHILLAPPFIIDESHIDEIVEKLARTLDSVLSSR